MAWTVPTEDVIAWRRHLHKHPELSFKETATSDFVEARLKEFGIETWRPTPTSVVGTVRGTRRLHDERITAVGLRADMDALPVQEDTGLEFASEVPGVMHACGHDAHTAMLLGTAKVLAENRDLFGGQVRLLFQHAEELNPGGAVAMVEAGALKDLQRVWALHVLPGPPGHVGVSRGPATSSAGGWFLTIQGKGAHGSMPHLGTDPALCASMLVVALNHVVGRNVDPSHFVVVNPGAINSGQAPNVVPDTATVGCSIRTYTPEDAELVYRRVDEVVEGICLAYGCTYEFNRVPPYDIVVNDDQVVDEVLASAVAVLGADKVAEVAPSSGSEDFSAMTGDVPGAFIQLFAGGPDEGHTVSNHHPKFDIVERPTLEAGVQLEVKLVLDRLG